MYYQYGGVIPIIVKEGPRKTKQELEVTKLFITHKQITNK